MKNVTHENLFIVHRKSHRPAGKNGQLEARKKNTLGIRVIRFFQNLTTSFVVDQFLPASNCNYHTELSQEKLASVCKTKEYIKINKFIRKSTV